MNTKTTLFFAYIILVQFLINVSSSKVKIAIKLRKDLTPVKDLTDVNFTQVGSKNQVSVDTKALVAAKTNSKANSVESTTSMSKAKSSTNSYLSLKQDTGDDVEFILKNPITLESLSYIPGLEFKLVNINKKEVNGDYNGNTVSFKNLAKGTYSIRITSPKLCNYEDTFEQNGNSLKNTVYLVEQLADNQWLVVLTWVNGVGKLLSSEVAGMHSWDEGLNEQQKVIKLNYGPQTVKFDIDKNDPTKYYASYEVYNKNGFNNIYDTGAKVAVYTGKDLVKVYSVPQVPLHLEGTNLANVWNVFQIIAEDKIPYHELNQISDTSTSPGWNELYGLS